MCRCTKKRDQAWFRKWKPQQWADMTPQFAVLELSQDHQAPEFQTMSCSSSRSTLRRSTLNCIFPPFFGQNTGFPFFPISTFEFVLAAPTCRAIAARPREPDERGSDFGFFDHSRLTHHAAPNCLFPHFLFRICFGFRISDFRPHPSPLTHLPRRSPTKAGRPSL